MLMLLACLAKRWAGIFSWHLTWENKMRRNSLHDPCKLVITTSNSFRAWHAMRESPSRVRSWMPTSLANYTPTSKALASAPTAPNGVWIFLLRATTTLPLSAHTHLITIAPQGPSTYHCLRNFLRLTLPFHR